MLMTPPAHTCLVGMWTSKSRARPLSTSSPPPSRGAPRRGCSMGFGPRGAWTPNLGSSAPTRRWRVGAVGAEQSCWRPLHTHLARMLAIYSKLWCNGRLRDCGEIGGPLWRPASFRPLAAFCPPSVRLRSACLPVGTSPADMRTEGGQNAARGRKEPGRRRGPPISPQSRRRPLHRNLKGVTCSL